MKVYEDKETGKWKVGSNGKAIHDSKKAAERAGLDALVDKLWDIIEKRNEAARSNGS